MAVQYMYPTNIDIPSVGMWETDDGIVGDGSDLHYFSSDSIHIASRIDEGTYTPNYQHWTERTDVTITDYIFFTPVLLRPVYDIIFRLLSSGISGETSPSSFTSQLDLYDADLDRRRLASYSFSNPFRSGLFHLQLPVAGTGFSDKTFAKYALGNSGLVVRLISSIAYQRDFACELYLDGETIPPIPYLSTYEYNPTLFISGPSGDSKSNTLYINNDPPSGIVDLFIQGPLPYVSSTTLFLEGHENTETGIPLFIEGHQSYYSGCDLYLEGGKIHDNIILFLDGLDVTNVNNDMDLVIWTDGANGSGQSSKYTTLFIENTHPSNSGIPLFIEGGNFGTKTNSIPLYINNTSEQTKYTTLSISNNQLALSGSTSLFTTSFYNNSGNAPLFIEGPASGDILKTTPLYLKTIDVSYYNTVSGRKPLTMTLWNNQQDKYKSMDLYIGQSTSSSGNIPLVIEGGGIDDRTKLADLYLHNRVESSGNVPLSLLTGVTIKSIPLAMTGLDPATDNSGIPLFIYSANGSGIFAGNELFLQSDTFGNTTPLFMNVIEVGYPISNIPLYINNDNESKMSMSVFLESTRWTSGTQNLFVNGLGLQPGAEVSRQNISMFLAREVDSDSYSMYMHLAAPSGESQVIPMTLEGGTYSQLETTLFLPEAMGNEGSGMNIFTHGI